MSSADLTEERDLLAGLLREALSAIEEEINNRDGEDRFQIGCPSCDGALPMPHSFGCRAYSALKKVGK